ncbi:MAG TPA: pyrroline-5-carboxylate reductase [Arachidicoccus sp.]|nr:pyrroline-5-carboxylate reductase [Arachidicoccus sp.]
MSKIAIIGGGNLGSAIAEGLINSGFSTAESLYVTRRNTALIAGLQDKGVNVLSDNRYAVAQADYIILAIKPFQVKEIIEEIKPELDKSHHVLISVVTGVWIKDLIEMAGEGLPIVRAMPNTAIAIQESMTCTCMHQLSEIQAGYVNELFNQLGRTVDIDEKLMDAATVLGACGTAFAMRYIRANIQGGVEIGFNSKVAAVIAAQTVKGAADLLLKHHTHPEQEIDKVTTPMGCTIAGLNEMEHRGLSSSIIRGITTSYRKIVD